MKSIKKMIDKKGTLFYLVIFLLGICYLIAFIPQAKAELYFWEDVKINTNENTVSEYAYYQFQDTSIENIGKNKEIPIILWFEVEALPFNSSGLWEVDWCNLTITHIKNTYDNEGNLLNVSEDIESFYFANSSFNSTTTERELKSRDGLIAEMKCHYNNTDYLYAESILVGRFNTYFPAFKCNDCTKYTLEELSNEIERTDEIITEETAIYNQVQKIIGFNFQLWLIVSWILKIGFIIIAVGLVFASIYYFYSFLKDVESKI